MTGGEDTGDNRDRDHLIDYLNQFFQRRTDLKDAQGRGILYSVIVSHPHIDHTRHLMAVMNGFKVKNFVGGGGTTGSGLAQFNQAWRFARDNNLDELQQPPAVTYSENAADRERGRPRRIFFPCRI